MKHELLFEKINYDLLFRSIDFFFFFFFEYLINMNRQNDQG